MVRAFKMITILVGHIVQALYHWRLGVTLQLQPPLVQRLKYRNSQTRMIVSFGGMRFKIPW